MRVDLASGLIVRFGAEGRQTEIRDFRWLDRADEEAFRVDGPDWEDFTSDPTEGDRDELLMLGHAGTWRPGMPGQDPDGRLLELKAGRFRRIPFQGSNVLPGCFLKGRDRVVVSGVNPFEGTMGLYRIDLKTGENVRLGGKLLTVGFTLKPVLSPDGRMLVALNKGIAGGPLETQACLVDVESGEARLLGEPRNQASFNWLPGGDGFIFRSSELADPDDLGSKSSSTICRMDLEGRVRKIREGESPVLLDGRTILFWDRAAKAWRTCGLDGGDEKPYAGGLPGYQFPSPAPDGKRILMMRFRPGAAPTPMILPIGREEGVPAVTAPGLWSDPAWR